MPSLITRRRRRPPSRTGTQPATVTQREIHLHGQQVTFIETGAHLDGPVVVLLHGLASSSQTWATVLPLLGMNAHVIAPDLLGHGLSAKPCSGDYSLGAYAAGLRDLLVALDVRGATIAGHSFGGGVAMQFAYQFPELTERLVLVNSGGLGHDVTLALRAATLPGTALALQIATTVTPRWLAHLSQRLVRVLPRVSGPEIDGLADAFDSFTDHGARNSFTHTVRGALNWSGQRLDGTERLYLLAHTPVLLIGGDRDSVIPVAHTLAAHDILPASRLEVFDGAGHFPHIDHPQRFAHVLLDFLSASIPARSDAESMRRQLLGTPSPTHQIALTTSATRGTSDHSSTMASSSGRSAPLRSSSSSARAVEVLQEVMRSELDVLVPPFCRAVVAGDDAHTV